MIKGATVTLAGYVASEPSYRTIRGTTPITSMRVAWTERYVDRVTGEWRDGSTSFATVNCWRGLASNAASSLRKGQAVVVVGRLQVRQSDDKEGRRIYVEIEADAIGHNLSRGITHFMRTNRPSDYALADGSAADRAISSGSLTQPGADADAPSEASQPVEPGEPGGSGAAEDEAGGSDNDLFEPGAVAELAEAEASAAAASPAVAAVPF